MTKWKLIRIAALCSLLAIAVLTLTPKSMRLITGTGDFGRVVAYLLTGLGLGLAFPRHRALILLALLCAAGTLEALQNLIPSRHARIQHFEIKALAALAGIAVSIPAHWAARVARVHLRRGGND
jgi:hypothetical protein